MRRIFDPDNFFFRWVSRVFDVMWLSVLWFILSIPVFTVGASTTALYDAVVKCVRGQEGRIWTRFWSTFRSNFRVGSLAALPAIALTLLLVLWYFMFGALSVNGDRTGTLIFVVYQFLCLVPLGLMGYLFPTLSRFDLGVKELWKTCGRLALGHIPATLVIGAAMALSVQLTLQLYFPVFFLPGVVTLIASLFLERIYKPFLPEGPDPEAMTKEAEEEPPEEFRK